MRILTTAQLMSEGLVPEIIGINLPHFCKCSAPILCLENLRKRWCANPYCPYHMQHKANEMFKHLGVKGIGPATCLEGILQYRLVFHMDLLPYVLKDVKPFVHLWEVGDMAAIEGCGPKFWQDTVSGYSSFEEYLDTAKVIEPAIYNNKAMLIKGQSYFQIKTPLSKRNMEVMVNGSISGYSNRDHFIDECNRIAGQVLRITAAKNNRVKYCITQNPLSEDSKVNKAREQGIPIVSPREFLVELKERIRELLREDS